jgi:hypothetical protein
VAPPLAAPPVLPGPPLPVQLPERVLPQAPQLGQLEPVLQPGRKRQKLESGPLALPPVRRSVP